MKNIKYTIPLVFVIGFLIFLSACKVAKKTLVSLDKLSIPDLVAYYPFNNNAKDDSGNDNDGKVNGAVLTSDRNGKTNCAYSFDGEDDFIYVPDSKVLRIEKQLTMSVWFKTDSTLPYSALLCKVDAEEPRRGYLVDITDENKVRTDITCDHSKAIGGTLFSTNNLVDNKWHHAVVTYNGKDLQLFIDGKLDNKKEYTKGFKNSNEPLLIGWDQNKWLSHRHFRGLIDDVRLYNRALSIDEVLMLFNEN